MRRHTILTLTRLDELQKDRKNAWDIIEEIIHTNKGRKDCAGRKRPNALRHLFESGDYATALSGAKKCERQHTKSGQYPNFKELIKESGKYVAFANCPEGRTDKQASGLLEIVKQRNAINKHKSFSNRIYEEIQIRLKWYGTGKGLRMKYMFEKNPTIANTAVGILTALVVGGVGMAGAPVTVPVAGVTGAIASFASFAASKKVP